MGAAHTHMGIPSNTVQSPLKFILICNNKSSVYVQLFELSQPKAVGKTYRSSRFLVLNPVMEPWK